MTAAFDRVQAARVELFGRVAALPEAVRRMRVETGAWTPLELLEHMVREDRMLLGRPAVRKGRATRNPLFPAAVNYERKGWTIPFTAPVLMPQGGWSFEEAAGASDAIHHDLAVIVAAAGSDEIVASNALVGTLTADQLCEAIEAHYQYHLKRLKLPQTGTEIGGRDSRSLADADSESRTPALENSAVEFGNAT